MRKKICLFLALVLLAFGLAQWVALAADCQPPSDSDSEQNLQQKIDGCQELLSISLSATKPNEQKMLELQKNIDNINANITALSNQIVLKEKSIAANEDKLVVEQATLSAQVRDFYKNDYQSDLEYLLITLFSSGNLGDTVQQLGYRQSLIDQQKHEITSVVLMVNDLNAAKKKLEDSKNWLDSEKGNLQVVLAPIQDLVNRAKAYQAQLSSTIGSLSARQQQLIAAKIGSLNLSRSAGALYCTDDRNTDPGFSPRLAFFTFGIPHRVGMNQYGAYGRAKYDNESYDQILHAYYNFDGYQTIDPNTNIKVNDGNDVNSGNIIWSGNLEDYVKRIYEVPDSWPPAALQAQAIAARSYVLAATNNGANSICANQNCQVFKTDPKGGNWDQAVKDTEDGDRGKVMVQGGSPIKAWFSSTDGGYTLSSGEVWNVDRSWTKHTRDTSGDIGSLSDLFSKAYDRDSACFYSAQGWRAQYNKSAWLKPEEVADIVNVILLAEKDASTQDHLAQVDAANPDGTDTWDANRVKSELQNRGGTPFNQITDVSMAFDFGGGRTTSVTVSGDAGSHTFDGSEFKNYFNLRAPANIAIVGPLYNIEKK